MTENAAEQESEPQPASPERDREAVALPAQSGRGPVEFQSLHPALRTVWLISGQIGALLTAAIPTLFELSWRLSGEEWFASPFTIPLLLLIVLSIGSAIFVRWRFDAWRYAIRPHDVLLHHGVFWRVRSCIPRMRIQHVDIQSGPIERTFGIAKLSLYTAGTPTAVGTIPGLTPAAAEALRERLLAKDETDG